jgi:hypothetical protein
MRSDITPEEAKTIAALRRLAKTWPNSLTLVASSGLSVKHTSDVMGDAGEAEVLAPIPIPVTSCA